MGRRDLGTNRPMGAAERVSAANGSEGGVSRQRPRRADGRWPLKVAPRTPEMATAGKGRKPKGGSVRFAPRQPPAGPPGHVRFQEQLRDSAVTVTRDRDGSFLVKVGFLKVLHKYEISFLLPPLQWGGDLCSVPLPSPNLRVTAITPLPEGLSVQCEYVAQREGVLRDEVLLGSEGAPVRVVVQARVMERHHGTPMLLDGVRCVGAELEYDSEQSDWHGFD
ncbi:adipose-secreted signaling protein [Aegotheles albertisi]